MNKKDYIELGVKRMKEDIEIEFNKITLKENFFSRLFINQEEEKRKTEMCLKYFEYGFRAGFLDGENYANAEILKTLKKYN